MKNELEELKKKVVIHSRVSQKLVKDIQMISAERDSPISRTIESLLEIAVELYKRNKKG